MFIKGFVSYIALVIATGLIVFWKRPITRRKQTPSNFGRISELATLLGLLVIAGSIVISSITTFKELLPEIYPTKYNPILAEISKTDEGLLLINSEEHRSIQLLTGRAVVLEPAAINMIPYSIHSAPDVVHVLNDIYGVDYFNPPIETQHRGYLGALDSVQQLWEERTSEEWRNFAQEYDFSQILTSPDWELQLPVVIRDDKMILYEIQ